ncbi:MAG: hypothetical protein ACJ72N_18355 [Labedaea sp.]
MDRFSVDPQELADAASTVENLAQPLADGSILGYKIDPNEVGDPELAAALTKLQKATTTATTVLRENALDTAQELALTATLYQETDDRGRIRLNSVYEDGGGGQSP